MENCSVRTQEPLFSADMEASVSNPSHHPFTITQGHTRLLHAQAAELKPKLVRPWDSQTLFTHRSPAGCRQSVTPRFNKLFVGRFLHVLHREAHTAVTYQSIRALDPNPHDTADCSDAVSREHRHLESVENSKNMAGCRSEIVAPKLDDIISSVDGSSPDSTVGLHGFVMGLNLQADAWDSGSMHAPVVRRYLSDNEERWMLWYSGKSQVLQGDAGSESKEVMGLAISSNGAHWKRGNGESDSTELIKDGVGKVLDCSENWWAFDTEITRPSDVLVMSSLKARSAAGVYWMYYTGGCSEETEILKPKNLPMNLPEFKYFDSKVVVLRTRPGLTMSHDGRNWARIEGDHYSGSLFDVGEEGEWDFLFIADPHVVYVNTDDLRLYYHSFDLKTGCFSVGYARSHDAMKWIKFGKILGGGPPGSFDELGVKSPQVVAHPSGKGFLMIYEGVAADGRTSFGLAQSKDGLSDWERSAAGPVFSMAEESNAWDSKEIHSPCLVHMDGNEWRLYYQGVSKTGKSGFGMALCTDGKLLKFQRCHGLLL